MGPPPTPAPKWQPYPKDLIQAPGNKQGYSGTARRVVPQLRKDGTPTGFDMSKEYPKDLQLRYNWDSGQRPNAWGGFPFEKPGWAEVQFALNEYLKKHRN